MPSRIDRDGHQGRKTPRERRDAPHLAVVILPPGQLARRVLGDAASLDIPGGIGVRPQDLRIVVQHVGPLRAGTTLRLIETVKRACAGIAPFWLTPLRLVSMPRGEAARRVAVELDTPASLLELKRRLAQRLARSARTDGADRFIPRMTLSRLDTPQPGLDVDATVDAPAFPVETLAIVETGAVRGSRLMREVGSVTLTDA